MMIDIAEEAVHPKEILNDLSKAMLTSLYKHNVVDIDAEIPKKKEMIAKISIWMEEYGIRTLVESLKRDDLKEACKNIKLNSDKEKEQEDQNINNNSKAVLSRRLLEKIIEDGIESYLTENCEVALLKTMCDALELEYESNDDKKEIIEKISSAVRAFGMESFFFKFDVTLLLEIMKDLNLKTNGSNSKRKLVDAIITKRNIKSDSPKKKKKLSFSKTKKPIEEGATYDDIFQHYYVEEVRDYCKAHGLKTAGKKKVLIHRILDHLNGNEDNTKSPTKRKNREKEKKDKSNNNNNNSNKKRKTS